MGKDKPIEALKYTETQYRELAEAMEEIANQRDALQRIIDKYPEVKLNKQLYNREEVKNIVKITLL